MTLIVRGPTAPSGPQSDQTVLSGWQDEGEPWTEAEANEWESDGNEQEDLACAKNRALEGCEVVWSDERNHNDPEMTEKYDDLCKKYPKQPSCIWVWGGDDEEGPDDE